MKMLEWLPFFFRRIGVSFSKKSKCAKMNAAQAFIAALRHAKPFSQLDAKIARARVQDAPVLYEHVLPGLDVLLCRMRGAQPPYPAIEEFRERCIEAIANALEQPLEGLENGGYWYEANNFGFLVFASCAREHILSPFGALGSERESVSRQYPSSKEMMPRSFR